MKSQLQSLIDIALQQLQQQQVIPADWLNKSTLERTKDNTHGDWASNLAMVAAKPAGLKPRDLAEKIVAALPTNDLILKIFRCLNLFSQNFFDSSTTGSGYIEQICAG